MNDTQDIQEMNKIISESDLSAQEKKRLMELMEEKGLAAEVEDEILSSLELELELAKAEVEIASEVAEAILDEEEVRTEKANAFTERVGTAADTLNDELEKLSETLDEKLD